MAPDQACAERFLRKLSGHTRQGRAYRGQVLSITYDCYRNLAINFHSLPKIQRSEIVLPEPVLRRLERHTIQFSRHTQRLQKAGRHLKRGILLHGLPGTGKIGSRGGAPHTRGPLSGGVSRAAWTA